MKPWLLIVWFGGLILAAVASWLLWIFLPAIHVASFSQELRFGISLLPLFLWSAVPMIFWPVLSKSAVPTESAAIRDQRRTAIAYLANRGIKGRRARYSLPFFLVSGPAGSGKSSFLDRSEMKLGMPMVIGDATWWIGADAVFIETSFASAGAPPREVFDLLLSLRPKLPVNATLLVVSPADLTLSDLAEQRMMTQAVTDGLKALDSLAGTSVPVYLVLSKTDLVPGFREFFDRYEQQEREQPWGFVPSSSAMASGQSPEARQSEIDRSFRDLLEAMRVRHMEWLAREPDPVRCSHLQGFAAQIAATQKIIAPLLENLEPEHDRNWNGSLLRGVFLTSARQEPLSIDALLPELSRRFAMPRIGMLPPDLGLDEEEYGYFIRGILNKVVLPEAGLVVRNRDRGLARYSAWGLIGAIMLVCAGTGYWIVSVFDRELKLAGRTYETAMSIRPVADPARRADFPALLESMIGLQTLSNSLAIQPEPREFAFGLSARPLLSAALDRAERGMQINALAEHLSARLEAELVDVDADTETLRKRLAVATDAGNADSPLVRDWLNEKAEALQPAEREVLRTQGMAAIRGARGMRIGAAYLDATRRLIAYRDSLS